MADLPARFWMARRAGAEDWDLVVDVAEAERTAANPHMEIVPCCSAPAGLPVDTLAAINGVLGARTVGAAPTEGEEPERVKAYADKCRRELADLEASETPKPGPQSGFCGSATPEPEIDEPDSNGVTAIDRAVVDDMAPEPEGDDWPGLRDALEDAIRRAYCDPVQPPAEGEDPNTVRSMATAALISDPNRMRHLAAIQEAAWKVVTERVESVPVAPSIPLGDREGHRVKLTHDGYGVGVELICPESGGCDRDDGGTCHLVTWVEECQDEILHGSVTVPVSVEWDQEPSPKLTIAGRSSIPLEQGSGLDVDEAARYLHSLAEECRNMEAEEREAKHSVAADRYAAKADGYDDAAEYLRSDPPLEQGEDGA